MMHDSTTTAETNILAVTSQGANAIHRRLQPSPFDKINKVNIPNQRLFEAAQESPPIVNAPRVVSTAELAPPRVVSRPIGRVLKQGRK
jgi:hypothetical protein